MNSVENFPPTFCVGESGVASSGWCSSSSTQLAPQRVELPVGDDRRVEHVVAELMISHLGGQPRVPLTSFGIGGSRR